MPFDILLLPLVGGYWFIKIFHWTRHSVSKQKGEELLLAASTAGLFFGILSFLLCSGVVALAPAAHLWWKSHVPWRFSGTALGALLLGPLVASIANAFVDKKRAEYAALHKFGNTLDKLFLNATEDPDEPKLVQITLDDNKVYVGWIEGISSVQTASNPYIAVLPTLSGYRDTRRQVQFTTSYVEVYTAMLRDKLIADDELEVLNDFRKVLPISRITSAGIFNPDVTPLFGAEKGNLDPASAGVD